MSRNIFYASNIQSDLFPNNSRTKFDQYIDINDLNYIKQNDEIEVAVTKISFDNKQSFLISPDINKPHFMLEQPITPQPIVSQFMDTMNNDDEGKEQGKIVKWSDNGLGKDMFNIGSSNDYIFINQCRSSDLMIVHFHKDRHFSNVMIVTNSNTIIHNIYLHQKECFYLDTFINHINNVLKNVTFYNDKNNEHTINTDLVNKKYILHGLSVNLFIREDIASVLEINKEKVVKSRLSDFFESNVPIHVTDCARIMKSVYMKEQNLVYYYVKRTKVKNFGVRLKLKPRLFHSKLYGIRSNLSDPTISSSQYDTLISVFQDYSKQDVLNIEFQNPCFFKTRKELLSRTHFDIIDINQSNQNPAIGAPTYIQTIVRPSSYKMKRPFTIFLDSSCQISKKLYPKNTNTDFTIELPERLNFRRDWTVTLKTLFLSNKIQNIEGCECRYRLLSPMNVTKEKSFTIKSGNYNTLSSFLHEISVGFRNQRMHLTIEESEEGRVKIKQVESYTPKRGYKVELRLSKYLACILGYTSSPIEDQYLRFDEELEYLAPHDPNLFLIYPKNLIVGCNIVDDTIFAGHHVKLLRLITNSDNLDSDILSFEFLKDEKVNLGIREFKNIHISIMDTTGSPVKSESNLPSRLQLTFSLEQ